mmetsp:Transcript_11457/g.15889  ORF Transcript_11457/g.15889 Transcript_11457/m.15889 type:complete len:488 (-) Transcript_11457:140-1603(-)|eukprot:CAMPEP_0185734660 /NCGR_PEP_ID=MMETSP1171-20130828/23159_1 /TAXON_ID=374046 /ORGANISM="Helicotheca tamensis, Strain CCMP826" /LENGTH=487 /DNA_ID=CAMNT_0028404721 /DNA_START=112 /DNA_END=1578 /DNA_ORIENTATION=+
MGKKKGRQSGKYASKSMRAAHQSEISLRGLEETLPHRKPLKWTNTKTFSKPAPSSSSSFMKSRLDSDVNDQRRKKVNVTQLRGILAERRMEDRMLDRDYRRQRQERFFGFSSGGVGNGQQQRGIRNGMIGGRGGGCVQLVECVERHEPGWLLFYDHEDEKEVEATSLEAERVGNDKVGSHTVPSLQHLAVQALGPYLSNYIEACGAEAIHSAVSTLSPTLLAELSACVCAAFGDKGGVTDEIAGVLGKHTHVERLALYAPARTLYDEEGGRGSGIDDGIGSLTEEGILSLVPRISQRSTSNGIEHDDCFNNYPLISSFIADDDTASAPESWEDIDIDLDVTIEGCTQLTRLELCNIQSTTINVETIYELLRSCPCITHLSISNSFTDEIGSELLLHPDYGLGAGRLLSNLKVLDVSHCTWMTDLLLTEFIRSHVIRGGGKNKPTLKMISVAGCTGVTKPRCDLLNEQLGGLPLISTKLQKKKRILGG